MMKMILKVLLVALMVIASTVRVDAKSTISERVQNIINSMSSTDKVAQMFKAGYPAGLHQKKWLNIKLVQF